MSPQAGGWSQVTQGLVADIPHREILPSFCWAPCAPPSTGDSRADPPCTLHPLCICLLGLAAPWKSFCQAAEKRSWWVTGGPAGVPQLPGGLPGSQALADTKLGCSDAYSKLGHFSMEDKSCPLSVQRRRFMPGTNLPQKHNAGRGKPSPSHSPDDSHVAKGQNPLFQLWSPSGETSHPPKPGAGLLLRGTQPKQQRQLVTWDFHSELLVSHQLA